MSTLQNNKEENKTQKMNDNNVQQTKNEHEIKNKNENDSTKDETTTKKIDTTSLGMKKSGKIWKQQKTRFSSTVQAPRASLSKRLQEREKLREMKRLEQQLKEDIEKEKQEEARRIRQRRRAKEEQLLKEKNIIELLKRKKKIPKGRNKTLTKKDYARVKSYIEMGLKPGWNSRQ